MDYVIQQLDVVVSNVTLDLRTVELSLALSMTSMRIINARNSDLIEPLVCAGK